MPDADLRDTTYAWFVVFVLALLQIGSYIDRQVINLLVEPLRRDFLISDTQISLLLGFAFAVFYAIVAVPIGRLADSFNRVAIVAAGVAFWSVATLGCMVASGYWHLFAARMLVGVGEAVLVPAGFSILSDYFRPGRLATATSVMTGASFVGSGIALVFGGTVIAALPDTPTTSLPVVGEVRSWQIAFGFASIPSLIFLCLMAFVREPARRDAGSTRDAVSFGDAIAFLAADKALWVSLFVGMALVSAFQFGLTAWIPTFFIRTYGWSATEIGQLYGACFVIFATLGTVAGGWLCDRLFGRYGRRAFVMTPLISAALTVPTVMTFALAGNATVSAVLLVPLTFFATLSFGAGVAAIPSLAPNRMRGQLVAAYMLVGTVIGQGGGPWLIAVYTDHVAGDPLLIGRSIAVVSPGLLLVAAAILWRAYWQLGRVDGSPQELSIGGPNVR